MTAVKICVLIALSWALLTAIGRGNASPPPLADGSTVPGELLVRFLPGPPAWPPIASLASHTRLLSRTAAVRYNRSLDVWRFHLRVGQSVDQALAELREDPRVALAQPNYRYTNALAPDDPLYVQRQRPYYAAINAPAGWDAETGDSRVVVAVLDGGVDIGHPELDGKIWTNGQESMDGQDNDGNGCIDDLHGCNLLASPANGDVGDLDGHGTFISGIIGAETNNGAGVAGMAWNATIMPVRMLDSEGLGTTEQLAAAILYAAGNGADVLNLSLALPPYFGTCPSDAIVDDALRRAHDEFGATIPAAAGNFNLPCVGFPGASPYTIAVGASGAPYDPDVRASFSQWGPEVDVAAPGVDIVSTCPTSVAFFTSFCTGEPYGVGNGTSFATPIVSGLAALLLSQQPNLTNEDVRQRIRATARDLPDEDQMNWDGAGIIDVGAALGAGTAFAVIDARGPDVKELDLSVIVGDPASPLCEVDIWQHPQVSNPTLHGSFGAGECASYWPPSVDRPWRLYGDNAARKAAVLNAWSLRQREASCSAGDLPATVPKGGGVIASINCADAGLLGNDSLGQALYVDVAALPRSLEEDIQYATSLDDPSPSCARSFSRSVWYRLPATGAPGAIVADTFGTAFDTVLAVFRGSPGDLQEVACNDDFNVRQSRVVWRTDGVSEYYVMAAALQTVPAGRLRMNFNPGRIPPNDSQETALSLEPAAVPFVQPAHSATGIDSDPRLSCVAGYGFSLWFRVSAQEGQRLTVSSEGSDYDTALGVFALDGGDTRAEVACNDDAGGGTRTSKASWQATAGDYLVVVGAFAGRVGGVLRLQLTAE